MSSNSSSSNSSTKAATSTVGLPPSTTTVTSLVPRKWAPGRMGRSRSTDNVSTMAGGAGGASPDSSPNPSIGGTPPTGTPPKKIWERHYRSFLSRRNHQQPSSTTGAGGDGSSSSLSSQAVISQQPPLTTAQSPTATMTTTTSPTSTSATLMTPQLHPKFTLVPGSKRLLQRVQQDHPNNNIQQPLLSSSSSQLSALSVSTHQATTTAAATIPSVPFLVQPNSNKSSFRSSSFSSPNLPHPSPPQRTQSEDVSVKGGNIFQTLFQKSPSSTSHHPLLPPLPQQQQQQPHRKTKSMDELDGSKRMGQEKGSYSVTTSPSASSRRHSLTMSPARLAMRQKGPPPPTTSTAFLAAPSLTSNNSKTTTTTTRSTSAFTATHGFLPNPMATSSHRTYGIVTEEEEEEDEDYEEEEDDDIEENVSLRSDGVMVTSLTLPPPPPPSLPKSSTTTNKPSSSLAMLLSQRQQEQQQMMISSSGLILPTTTTTTTTTTASPTSPPLQPPESQVVVAVPSSSSPSTSAREMKKAFTQFHNSAMYAQDSTSAFLGDEPSTKQGTAFLGLLRQQQQQQQQEDEEEEDGETVTAAAAAESFAPDMPLYSSGSSDSNNTEKDVSSRPRFNTASAVNLYSAASSYPLETVEEHVTMHRTVRMLKPIQSPETWHQGRRYLIAPAALATCPLQVLSALSSPMAASLTPAAAVKELCSQDDGGAINGKSPTVSNEWLAFCGSICLGEAAISYVIGDNTSTSATTGSNHTTSSIASRKHLQLGRWTSCWLVLRQNYLLEFDVEHKHAVPRGYAHLQYAVSYLHADFADSVVLEFFPSPCAHADKRVLMIKVANREDRQHWVTCLNAAAQLKITDLYDYDPKVEFGRGRYAAVYPARRRGRDRQTYEDKLSLEGLDPKAIVKQCDCAIKIIDKNEFWKRVVKGKERADTLVREVTTQATLTAKCGGQISTFVRLRGFFETANEVVLELELLEGFDLFKYVSSKGVLDETEAACITRDILTSLENMHRVGLSHRDIKPANILMCDLEKHGAHVKVGDFGMATFIGVDGLVRGRCGTPGYVAPEIFNAMKRGGYGVNADVFSTGVTLYVMLCGYEPFYGETDDELVAANREACFEFPEGDWSSVSAEARDLLQQMMAPDPKKRISAKLALQHPWIVNRTMNQPGAKTVSAGGESPTNVQCSIS